MTVMDTTSVYEAIDASEGCTVAELDAILPLDYPAILRQLRRLRDKKQVICLGRGTKARWFTMVYYLANKVKLEAEHGKNCKMKSAAKKNNANELNYIDDWCGRIANLDSLMRPRV